jgi:hypothetical protein
MKFSVITFVVLQAAMGAFAAPVEAPAPALVKDAVVNLCRIL